MELRKFFLKLFLVQSYSYIVSVCQEHLVYSTFCVTENVQIFGKIRKDVPNKGYTVSRQTHCAFIHLTGDIEI